MSKRLAALALVAGCATPAAPAGVGGEPASTRAATPVGHDTSAPGSPLRKVLLRPTEASRSRGVIPRRTGSLLESTAYCETGLMANGHRTYRGAVAGNRWPLGTRLYVSDSPYGPGTFTVADRIGHSSSLDFAVPGDCNGARSWGRRDVRVEVAR